MPAPCTGGVPRWLRGAGSDLLLGAGLIHAPVFVALAIEGGPIQGILPLGLALLVGAAVYGLQVLILAPGVLGRGSPAETAAAGPATH